MTSFDPQHVAGWTGGSWFNEPNVAIEGFCFDARQIKAGQCFIYSGPTAPAFVANFETNIQQRIRLALGTDPNVRLFRNQVGGVSTNP